MSVICHRQSLYAEAFCGTNADGFPQRPAALKLEAFHSISICLFTTLLTFGFTYSFFVSKVRLRVNVVLVFDPSHGATTTGTANAVRPLQLCEHLEEHRTGTAD